MLGTDLHHASHRRRHTKAEADINRDAHRHRDKQVHKTALGQSETQIHTTNRQKVTDTGSMK